MGRAKDYLSSRRLNHNQPFLSKFFCLFGSIFFCLRSLFFSFSVHLAHVLFSLWESPPKSLKSCIFISLKVLYYTNIATLWCNMVGMVSAFMWDCVDNWTNNWGERLSLIKSQFPSITINSRMIILDQKFLSMWHLMLPFILINNKIL